MAGVLLIGPVAPPSGGVASHIDDLMSALTADLAPIPAKRIALPVELRAHAFVALRLALNLATARSRGDIVHLHTNGHNDGSWNTIAAVAKIISPSHLVVTLHSGMAPSYISNHTAFCRRHIDQCHTVVCVNDLLKRSLTAIGYPSERILVAPAFSSHWLPFPLRPAGISRVRRLHEPLLVATLADGREYGASILFSAFAEFSRQTPRAGLVLLGPAARDPLIAYELARHDLTEHVHCFSDLSRSEALGAIAASDLFIRPTLADGDSLSVREALALGKRVVASDASRRPEEVTLFRAGNHRALVHAISEALAANPPDPVVSDATAAIVSLYRSLIQEETSRNVPTAKATNVPPFFTGDRSSQMTAAKEAP